MSVGATRAGQEHFPLQLHQEAHSDHWVVLPPSRVGADGLQIRSLTPKADGGKVMLGPQREGSRQYLFLAQGKAG